MHDASTEKGLPPTVTRGAPAREDRSALTQLQQVDALCDRFEHAWKSGQSPGLGAYLAELPDLNRVELLCELAPIELHYRRSGNGGPLSVDELAQFHPHLAKELAQMSSLGNLPSIAMSPNSPFPTSGVPRDVREGARSSPQDKDRRGLSIRCPSCRTAVELHSDSAYDEVVCNVCGSHFSLVDRTQVTESAAVLQTIGRFELIARLGVGGFGAVWKARDAELDRTVALKIPRKGHLRADEIEHFFREARAVAQLRHPHIAPVFEIGRAGDVVFIVSEYIRGVALSSWMDVAQPDLQATARIGVALADALEHAHHRGVIHRDVKPSNILIDDQNQPYLVDFGLAKRSGGEIALTRDGQILGTAAYMSPEQAAGRANDVDGRADVYALGVILYQLATDELPFRGNYEMQLHQKIHDDAPDPRRLNRRIPRDFATICLKCLERDPANRYSSAALLRDELQRLLDGKPLVARPISQPQRVLRWAHRKPAAALLAALTIAVAIGAPTAALVIKRQKDVIAAQLEKRDFEFAGQQTTIAQQRNAQRELQRRLDALSGLDPQIVEFLPGWKRKLAAEAYARQTPIAAALLANSETTQEQRVQLRLGMALMAGELGRVAEAIEHWEAARGDLETMRQVAPNDPRVAIVLADCCARLVPLYRDQGHDAKAIERADLSSRLRNELAQSAHRVPAIDVDRLESLLDRTVMTPDGEEKKRALEQASQLHQEIIANWPSDAAGIYRAACRLTLNDPLWALPHK